MAQCTQKTEVYSRIVGYYRPVQQWNKGKQEEYKNRKVFTIPKNGPDGNNVDSLNESKGLTCV